METGSHGSVVAQRGSLLSISQGADARRGSRETVVMNEEVPEQASGEEEAEVRTNVQ